MSETEPEDRVATNQIPNGNDLTTQGQGDLNINTEKSLPNHEQPTTSTPKTHNQKTIKEDWSSLMFSSDDSLFDEMTKQLEDDNARPETDKKSLSATSTITKTSTSTKDQETLPDIIHTSNRTEAATGLLMLGVDLKEVDTQIDKELMMPVNKPKLQDQNNVSTGDNNKNKQNKWKKKKRKRDSKDSSRRSTHLNGKPEPTTPKTTSTISIFLSSPSSPGSPRGVLKVTHYKQRKGTPNKYVHKPLKCSMCDQAVNSKDKL